MIDGFFAQTLLAFFFQGGLIKHHGVDHHALELAAVKIRADVTIQLDASREGVLNFV